MIETAPPANPSRGSASAEPLSEENSCREDSAFGALADEACALARQLALRSLPLTTSTDRARQQRLHQLVGDPNAAAFTNALSDQAFRAQSPRRAAERLRALIAHFGLPSYLTPWERLQFRAFQWFSPVLPSIAVAGARAGVRAETRHVLIDAQPDALAAHLQARRAEGVPINLNHLGESILSEVEAEARLRRYLDTASRPDVASISVKISSIASHIDVLAWDHVTERLASRLRRLYRAARRVPYVDRAGAEHPKWVMLDMEEYRDLALTAHLFHTVLDEPEFIEMPAGIVLQAYLPDSHPVQRQLTDWAQRRLREGGHPIRIRLVKGANLAMEAVEASHQGWMQAPYATKREVDANYKRMMDWALEPERARAVRLGVASHNLFDIALACVASRRRGLQSFVEFEMLEGMADPLRRAVEAEVGQVLVYAPTVGREEMQSAIAYLIRRLDENTADENFLRHSFALDVESAEWADQQRRFLDALALSGRIEEGPRRQQDRTSAEAIAAERGQRADFASPPLFANEPDTDWTLPHQRAWIGGVARAWRQMRTEDIIPSAASSRDGELAGEPRWRSGSDPSVPGRVPYRVALQPWEQLDALLDVAVSAASAWSAAPLVERRALLLRSADALRLARGELIGAMMAEGGKAIRQADTEVSEAIDFAEYYARSLNLYESAVASLGPEEHAGSRAGGGERHAPPHLHMQPRGVVLVTPPWNFPLAIPFGGVFAALVAGNSVVLKPAPEATWVAWRACQVLWTAGVPRDLLQFAACEDDPVGTRLIQDERVAAVVLTGGTDTARLFWRLRPTLPLFAETGGKNAMIVTDLADRDLAIAATIYSAFGHSGQKCSATSLLICEAPVYDDPSFRQRLAEAAASIPVGSAWDPASEVTPLIHAPSGSLAWALTELDDGEEWLVQPRQDEHNPALWSPGVKWGVRPNSRSHRTEFFGPVLSVMRAESLDHAIELANAVPFGLTGGLQSLDPAEQRHWAARIDAGNLYVNRSTTGAIVQRQPFGGRKASSFGPGAKAGGPNYVFQFAHWRTNGLPPAERRAAVPAEWEPLLQEWAGLLDEPAQLTLRAAAESAAYWWRQEFGRAHDPSSLLGESNEFRYQSGDPEQAGPTAGPPFSVLVRVSHDAPLQDVALVRLMATAARAKLHWSAARTRAADLPATLRPIVHIESDDATASRLSQLPNLIRVRIVGSATDAIIRAAHAFDLHVESEPPLLDARIEMLRYLREQSHTRTTHRYGLVVRSRSPRSIAPRSE